MSGRTIALGDIHGCAAALAAVIDAVQLLPDDTLVTLGDYVDRGPQSRQVLDLLLQLETDCRLVPLLGNHELMLLDVLDGHLDDRFWRDCGGQETLQSYGGKIERIPPAHIDFLRRCLPYFETDSHIFLHASYAPDLPLEDQPHSLLFWQHLADIPQPHVSGKTVVVGHTPLATPTPLDAGHLLCLDTFCYGSGCLTALDVLTRQTWRADKHGQLQV